MFRFFTTQMKLSSFFLLSAGRAAFEATNANFSTFWNYFISYTGTKYPFVNDFYKGFESFEYLFDKIRNFTRNENRFHFKAQKANDKCSPCIKVLSLHSKLFHLQLQWTLNEHPNLEFSFIRVVIFMDCDLFIV